jgi:two-component sensor histidine kinase
VVIVESNISTSDPERLGAWLYLDEVMHRVLNDYTAMLSMVRFASLRVSEPECERALEELTHRLNASAVAFRALSRPFDRAPRALGEELESLCASLSASLLAKDGIGLTLIADTVRVEAQPCWKMCLIVSELIVNAARHAFHGCRGGSIAVKLSVQGGAISCAVVDDGSAPMAIAPGRGSAIVDAIAAELGGTVDRNHTIQGSAVVLHVPIGDHRSPDP